jgi:hypothetical protein
VVGEVGAWGGKSEYLDETENFVGAWHGWVGGGKSRNAGAWGVAWRWVCSSVVQ